MADSEKLDNQRLKNFKNKGRDLEVKVLPIGVDLRFGAAAAPFTASFAPWLPCDVVSNFHGNFALKASAGAFVDRQFDIVGLGGVNIWFTHRGSTVRPLWLLKKTFENERELIESGGFARAHREHVSLTKEQRPSGIGLTRCVSQ